MRGSWPFSPCSADDLKADDRAVRVPAGRSPAVARIVIVRGARRGRAVGRSPRRGATHFAVDVQHGAATRLVAVCVFQGLLRRPGVGEVTPALGFSVTNGGPAEVAAVTRSETHDHVREPPGDRRDWGRIGRGVGELKGELARAHRDRCRAHAAPAHAPAPGDRLPEVLLVGQSVQSRAQRGPPVKVELFGQLQVPVDFHAATVGPVPDRMSPLLLAESHAWQNPPPGCSSCSRC